MLLVLCTCICNVMFNANFAQYCYCLIYQSMASNMTPDICKFNEPCLFYMEKAKIQMYSKRFKTKIFEFIKINIRCHNYESI